MTQANIFDDYFPNGGRIIKIGFINFYFINCRLNKH